MRKPGQDRIAKSKKKASSLKTVVTAEVEAVEKEIKQVDGLTENTWLKTYTLMFRKLKKIMRRIEDRVMDSEKAADIYALMALYNQMREVIADIRTIIDMSQNTQRIIDKVLYPMVRDISNNYVDAIFLIKKSVRTTVDDARYLELRTDIDSCLREHAKYIQSSYERSSEALAKLLEE